MERPFRQSSEPEVEIKGNAAQSRRSSGRKRRLWAVTGLDVKTGWKPTFAEVGPRARKGPRSDIAAFTRPRSSTAPPWPKPSLRSQPTRAPETPTSAPTTAKPAATRLPAPLPIPDAHLHPGHADRCSTCHPCPTQRPTLAQFLSFERDFPSKQHRPRRILAAPRPCRSEIDINETRAGLFAKTQIPHFRAAASKAVSLVSA